MEYQKTSQPCHHKDLHYCVPEHLLLVKMLHCHLIYRYINETHCFLHHYPEGWVAEVLCVQPAQYKYQCQTSPPIESAL